MAKCHEFYIIHAFFVLHWCYLSSAFTTFLYLMFLRKEKQNIAVTFADVSVFYAIYQRRANIWEKKKKKNDNTSNENKITFMHIRWSASDNMIREFRHHDSPHMDHIALFIEIDANVYFIYLRAISLESCAQDERSDRYKHFSFTLKINTIPCRSFEIVFTMAYFSLVCHFIFSKIAWNKMRTKW